MTPQESQKILQALLADYKAKIGTGQGNPVDEIKTLELDLSVARDKINALKVSFPFKNVRVDQATDLNTFITIVPENNDMGRSGVNLGINDSFKTEYGFSSAYIYWDAQPNKKMVLKFFTTSEIDNGRLVIDDLSINTDTFLGLSSAPSELIKIVQYGGKPKSYAAMKNKRRTIRLQEYNNNPSSAIDTTFVLPDGYEAEVIGAELYCSNNFALKTMTGAAAGLNFSIFLASNDTTTPDIAFSSSMDITDSYPSSTDYQALEMLPKSIGVKNDGDLVRTEAYKLNVRPIQRLERPEMGSKWQVSDFLTQSPYRTLSCFISQFTNDTNSSPIDQNIVTVMYKLTKKVGS